MFSLLQSASLLAAATFASATVTLKPIADPHHLFPSLIKPRDTSGVEVFNPQSIHSFYWADVNPKSSYVANFTLVAPGEHEDIIALKDIADRLKSITCDNATDTITIELQSQECYEHASKVWQWVNEGSDNTFTLVTEAGQCDPDDIRDPYFVKGAKFEEKGWKITFDARRQTWAEVAHTFRLRTKNIVHEGVQGANGSVTDDESDFTFHDEEMDKLLNRAERLQEELANANRTGSLGAGKIVEAKEAFSEVINATATKGFTALDQLSARYGAVVKDIVHSARSEYHDTMTLVAQKEAEAQNTTNWSLHEQSLELQESAIEVLNSAFISVYSAVGQTPPNQSLSARSMHLEKRGFFNSLWNGVKKVGETIINGAANLLGANKPMTIDLKSQWTPEIFHAGTGDADFGMELSVGAQLTTGGKIVAEFEVDVDFDEASKVQVHVDPEGVFGSLTLNVTAEGALKKPLQWEPAHFDVSIPGAGFEIPFLIKLGPSFAVGVRASVESLSGKATLGVGAKATISDDATVRIDMLNAKNNEVSGWTPEFEKMGPDFSAQMEGQVAAWLSLALKFEASILGGKIGAKAELEAQAPRFDARFSLTSSNNGPTVCDSTSRHGIQFEADIGVNLNLNAGLVGIPSKLVNGGAPLVKLDLLNLSWPLFSTCKAIGDDSSPQTAMPTISAGEANVPAATPAPDITTPPVPDSTVTLVSDFSTTTVPDPAMTPALGEISSSSAALSSIIIQASEGNSSAPTTRFSTATPLPGSNGTASATNSFYGTGSIHAIASASLSSLSLGNDTIPLPTPVPSSQLHSGAASTTCSTSGLSHTSEAVCTTKTTTVVECGTVTEGVATATTVTVVQTVTQAGPTITVTQKAY